MEDFAVQDTGVAAAAAFLIADIEAVNGGRGTVEISVTSQFGEVRKTRASVHYYVQGDVHVPYNSCTMLVLAGESFSVNVAQSNPTVKASYRQIPLP
jgi:hypothetical protein